MARSKRSKPLLSFDVSNTTSSGSVVHGKTAKAQTLGDKRSRGIGVSGRPRDTVLQNGSVARFHFVPQNFCSGPPLQSEDPRELWPSVCGRGAGSGAKAESNALNNGAEAQRRAPSRRRKPPFMRPLERMSLVTSARFAKWNGRGREGEGADRQAVNRSKTARWSRRLILLMVRLSYIKHGG